MKCIYCGEIYDSYRCFCPACGKELPKSASASSVGDLIVKLQEIDEEKKEYLLNLEARKNKIRNKALGYDDCSEDMERVFEEKKIVLIRAFPIPATFEGIHEFMLLAVSCFDARYYAEHLNKSDVSDAWLAKMEQAYQKADIMFGEHPGFRKIQRLYDKVIKDKDEAIAKRKKEKRNILLIISSCVALIAIILSIVLPLSLRGKQVGNTAGAFLGEPIEVVVSYFEDKGFKNITIVGTSEELDNFEAGDVVGIKINGISDFSGEDRFKRKAPIEIIYIRKYLTVSVDAKELKNKNYEDAVSLLKNMGFTNIRVVEEKDVTLGLIHDVGDVKSVSIDGDEKFSSGDGFWSDAVIVITYHGKK